MANGVLTQAYLELFPAGDENVAKVLEYLGFASTDEMAPFWMPFWSIIPFAPKQMSQAIPTASWSRRVRLATFPYPLEREDIYNMYRKSLLK